MPINNKRIALFFAKNKNQAVPQTAPPIPITPIQRANLALVDAFINVDFMAMENALKDGANINYTPDSQNENNLLGIAAECGDLTLVKFLVEHNADVDAIQGDGVGDARRLAKIAGNKDVYDYLTGLIIEKDFRYEWLLENIEDINKQEFPEYSINKEINKAKNKRGQTFIKITTAADGAINLAFYLSNGVQKVPLQIYKLTKDANINIGTTSFSLDDNGVLHVKGFKDAAGLSISADCKLDITDAFSQSNIRVFSKQDIHLHGNISSMSCVQINSQASVYNDA